MLRRSPIRLLRAGRSAVIAVISKAATGVLRTQEQESPVGAGPAVFSVPSPVGPSLLARLGFLRGSSRPATPWRDNSSPSCSWGECGTECGTLGPEYPYGPVGPTFEEEEVIYRILAHPASRGAGSRGWPTGPAQECRPQGVDLRTRLRPACHGGLSAVARRQAGPGRRPPVAGSRVTPRPPLAEGPGKGMSAQGLPCHAARSLRDGNSA
jgi:hypothetical protein